MSSLYYHGSGSASLIGVLNKDNPGLKPTGTLIEEGEPIFGGELEGGIRENGGSLIGISAVPSFQLRYAINYALEMSREGWTPLKGEAELRDVQKLLEHGRRSKTDYSNKYRLSKPELERLKAVLETRLEFWNCLSKQEQQLVREPFPVVYGISYSGEVISVVSPCYDEVLIPDVVPPSNLRLYVPHKEIQIVKRMLKGIPLNPCVVSHSQMRKLSMPKNCHDSLDLLLTLTARKYKRAS